MPEDPCATPSGGFLERYHREHRHPLNRLTHYIGIPMIVVSLGVIFWDWRWGLGLFAVGWVFQFLGHFIEGNRPAFFSNPVYLLVGPVYLLRRAVRALVGRPST